MTPAVFDATRCELGEGGLWHPERGQIFWFDILSCRLHSRSADGPQVWDFPEQISAGGWIDRDRLAVFSETGLWRFDLITGARERIVAVEADRPHTRSNDGGADPWGGVWMGTMGKNKAEGAGSLYRWYKGELRCLCRGMTVPNVMAFDTVRGRAYVSDTPRHMVWMYRMDGDGWPVGEPEVFLDLRAEGLSPDGGSLDTEGRFWSAQWGAGRVAVYSPEGAFLMAVPLPASLVSRPAFGGPDYGTLFITTAQEDMSAEDRAREPQAGMTFAFRPELNGQPVRGLAPFRVDA